MNKACSFSAITNSKVIIDVAVIASIIPLMTIFSDSKAFWCLFLVTELFGTCKLFVFSNLANIAPIEPWSTVIWNFMSELQALWFFFCFTHFFGASKLWIYANFAFVATIKPSKAIFWWFDYLFFLRESGTFWLFLHFVWTEHSSASNNLTLINSAIVATIKPGDAIKGDVIRASWDIFSFILSAILINWHICTAWKAGSSHCHAAHLELSSLRFRSEDLLSWGLWVK